MGLGIKKRIALDIFTILHNRLVKEHPMRSLFWESTLKCNLQCRHCGSDCKSIETIKDMPADDFLNVTRDLASKTNPHDVFVIITGGEPLMRSDLELIGKELYKQGYPWGIVTNGMLMTGERLAALMNSGMRSATVSLDGMERNHNYLRGNPQSYRRAKDTLELFTKTEDLVYDVVTCVGGHNIDCLNEFKSMLLQMGVKRWRIFTIFPSGRAANDDSIMLTDKQFVDLMEFIKLTRQEGRINLNFACEGFLGRYEGEVRDSFYQCNAGVTICGIRINGDISGCTSIRADFNQGNIYKDDLWDVWNNRFQPFRDRSWAKIGRCASCNMFKYCMGNGMHLHDGFNEAAVCHYRRV